MFKGLRTIWRLWAQISARKIFGKSSDAQSGEFLKGRNDKGREVEKGGGKGRETCGHPRTPFDPAPHQSALASSTSMAFSLIPKTYIPRSTTPFLQTITVCPPMANKSLSAISRQIRPPSHFFLIEPPSFPRRIQQAGVTTQAGNTLIIGWPPPIATRLHQATGWSMKLRITSRFHRAPDWSALGNKGRIERLVGQLSSWE